MASEEFMKRFMALESVQPPKKWMDKKKEQGWEVVLLTQTEPISQAFLEKKGLRCLFVKNAKQTCFYALYDGLKDLTENFKIYNINDDFFAIEVEPEEEDGTEQE